MLFDGSCPLCAREVKFLRSLPRSSQVHFDDVTCKTFNPDKYGKSLPELLEEMHVYSIDTNTMHTRVRAFRELYRTIFGIDVLFFSAYPPFDSLCDRMYGFIAKEKHRVAWMFR